MYGCRTKFLAQSNTHCTTGPEILSATLVLLHVEYSATTFIYFVSEIFMPLLIC